MEKSGKIDKIRENIGRIVRYTEMHRELHCAHHFLYDLRSPKHVWPDYMVMGINPGESPYDWIISPAPTQETSEYDFHHVKGEGRSHIPFERKTRYILGDAPYVSAEAFFWSSPSSKFTERFGEFSKSPHLEFCKILNLDLIEIYQPKAVIFTAISKNTVQTVKNIYSLSIVNDFYSNGVKIASQYTSANCPWVFVRHLTGARGLSNDQLSETKSILKRITC